MVACGKCLIGANKVSGSFLNRFYGEGYVHIPLRLEIPALVFAKSMRKKDIRGIGKKPQEQIPDEIDGTSKNKDEDDEEGDETKKPRQAVINLVGVDANRIANYMGISSWIFGAIVRLAISVYFLHAIVGLLALLVGIALLGLTLPMNIYFTNKYLGAQDNLMKARDKKLEVVNEALGEV